MLKLPLALALGVVMFVVRDVGHLLAVGGSSLDLEAALLGMQPAANILVAVGLFELARGSSNGALRIAAALFVIPTVWHAVWPLVEVSIPGHYEWSRYAYFASAGAATASALVLVHAVNGLKQAPVASVLLLVSIAGDGWVPFVEIRLFYWLWEHRAIGALYWLANGMMWAFGIVMLARLAHREVAPDAKAAASGLRVLARALQFRIVIALVIAAVGLGLVHGSALRAYVYGVPLVVFATVVVSALGMLRVARSGIEGLPVTRIAIGAALVLWWACFEVFLIDRGIGMTWVIAGPLVGAAGLALAGNAIAVFARARGHEGLREAASVRTPIFAVCSVSSLVIQSQIHKARTYEGMLAIDLLAAIAAIVALLSLATIARQAAAVIGKGAVPEARVVST